MNHEQQLQLQSYLDGELSPAEAKAVIDWLATDNAAREIFEELKMTRTVLVENEPELKLPESREFFWSKIQRQIEREEPQPVAAPISLSPFSWIQRYLVPVAAAAVVAFVAMVALDRSEPFKGGIAYGGIETLNDDMSSISFRSEAERMTVIYLYDRASNSESEISYE